MLKGTSPWVRGAIAVALFVLALGISEWMRVSQPDHVWIVYYAFFRVEVAATFALVLVPTAAVSATKKPARR